MTALAGGVNLAIALTYFTIGTLIAVDLDGQMRRRGWSHFGVAWLTIMYTCGAHHLVHGVHLAAEGRVVGWLDVLAVTAGLLPGAVWSLLRLEARAGGRGDRLVRGTPAWLRALAAAYAAVAGLTVGGGVLAGLARGVDPDPLLLPNVLLAGLYTLIAVHLARGQRRSRGQLGGWSTSGLGLLGIFSTCALMHLTYVVDAATGSFGPDVHGLWVDWAGVPAGIYFLWVVRGLERGTLRDWNERFEAVADLAEGGTAEGGPTGDHPDLGTADPEPAAAGAGTA